MCKVQTCKAWKVFIILFYAFLFLNVSIAQLREPFLQHITVEDGLSQSSVYSILQDKQGFLWFGTGDGLNKFDGYEITTYRHHQNDTNTISDNTIRTLMEDREGNLWIGTADGLNKYEPSTGTFTLHQIGNVEALLQDSRGTIWAGGSNGLWWLDSASNSFQPYEYRSLHTRTNLHRYIKSMYEDHTGNLWMGTIDGIDVIERSGMFKCFDEKIRKQLGVNLFVSALTGSNDGNLWITSFGQGLLKYNYATGEIQKMKRQVNGRIAEIDPSISSLCFDGRDVLWMGTKKTGVTKLLFFKKEDTPVTEVTEFSEVFKSYDVRTLFKDRSGLMWIGTDGDGVYKIDPRPKKFKHIFAKPENKNSLSGNFLKTIYEDSKERVWIGTYEQGLTLWEKKTNTFKHFLNRNGNTNEKKETVYAVTEDSSGTIWIGTENGLAQFNERLQRCKYITSDESQPIAQVTSLVPSSSGYLWMRMISNLYRFDFNNSRFEQIPFNTERFATLKSASIVCMFEDSKGILWLGTYDGGLNRYNPRTQECTTYLYDKMNQNSLSQNMVKVIYESHDGALWIGTGHGLNKFEQATETFTRYFEEDGLPSAYIYGILEDTHGNIWLSTNKGISKFNPATKQFRNYGGEDGLQSNEFNSGACFKNKNGEMYFGGINGMNVFHPDSVRDNSSLPQIVLTGFKKLDLPVSLQQEISTINSIVLDYEEGIFSLRFAALEYSNPKKNQYAYMLEGFERNWVFSGTRREVRYTHLDPGEYIFRVKGSNNDGVWNEEGIRVKVTVVPPFWRTWWFLSLTVFVGLISVGGTIRFFEMRKVHYRVELLEREREMERERARISQDMHDEIGASLTQIAILSEIARRELNDRLASERHLQKISHTARGVVDSISEIVWAINPKNDSLDNLISFIREYASEFFEATETRCLFEIPQTIPQCVLTGQQRRNMFLVVKESLNNILKHANANEVQLQFITTNDSFSIIIKDNGTGFCPKEISQLSNGLNNMKRRMETIGGTFELDSTQGVGTTVIISLKIASHA